MIAARSLGGGKMINGMRIFRHHCIKIRMDMQLHQMPVIQPGAFEIFIAQLKAQRLNQVQHAPRRRAGAGDIDVYKRQK